MCIIRIRTQRTRIWCMFCFHINCAHLGNGILFIYFSIVQMVERTALSRRHHAIHIQIIGPTLRLVCSIERYSVGEVHPQPYLVSLCLELWIRYSYTQRLDRYQKPFRRHGKVELVGESPLVRHPPIASFALLNRLLITCSQFLIFRPPYINIMKTAIQLFFLCVLFVFRWFIYRLFVQLLEFCTPIRARPVCGGSHRTFQYCYFTFSIFFVVRRFIWMALEQ